MGLLRRLVTWNQPVLVKTYSGPGALALNGWFMRRWGYEISGPAQPDRRGRLMVTWTRRTELPQP